MNILWTTRIKEGILFTKEKEVMKKRKCLSQKAGWLLLFYFFCPLELQQLFCYQKSNSLIIVFLVFRLPLFRFPL